MKGIRELSKMYNVKEADLKRLLLHHNIDLFNPIAIETGIIQRQSFFVNGQTRTKIVYNEKAVEQIVQGTFQKIDIPEYF